MDTKILTADKQALLTRPLPAEAVTPHPTKTYLSSIKSIYVTERLNEVFGVGAWRVETNKVDQSNKMVVVKVRLTIPAYGIDYECYGGNDNADLGDAYKGATTDALTKIASWLGIGQEVFKGEASKAHKPSPITTMLEAQLPQSVLHHWYTASHRLSACYIACRRRYHSMVRCHRSYIE